MQVSISLWSKTKQNEHKHSSLFESQWATDKLEQSFKTTVKNWLFGKKMSNVVQTKHAKYNKKLITWEINEKNHTHKM